MTTWATSGNRRLQYVLVAGDIALLFFSAIGALWFRTNVSETRMSLVATNIGALPVFASFGLYVLVFYIFNLYSLKIGTREFRCFGLIVAALGTALVVTAASMFFISPGSVIVGRTILITHTVSFGVFAWLWRVVYARWLHPQWAVQRVGILADAEEYAGLVGRLVAAAVPRLEIVRDFTATTGGPDSPASRLEPGSAQYSPWSEPQAGSVSVAVEEAVIDDLLAATRVHQIDVIVCSIRRDTPESLIQAAIALRKHGVEVYDFPSFYSSYFGKIPLDAIDAAWVLQAVVQRPEPIVAHLRRLADLLGALVLLLISLPVMAILAVVVRMTSPGPAIFVQERLGRHGKPFPCYKFRTMVTDAEAESGPRWATERDPRLTPVGAVLRRTRLDELPQLFNVLKGEMSLVGFRPIRQHFAEMLAHEIPFYFLRFSIKPGLTGWPQVRHDYAGSVHGQREKFEYELFYLAKRSLLLDAYILIKTIQVMLFGRGQ